MNTIDAGKFTKGRNNGTRVCAECGTRRQVANMANEMCCVDCYEIAGLENEHLDGGHEDSIVVDCPMCKQDAEELNIELPAAAPESDEAAEAAKIARFFENEPAASSLVLERRSITGQLIGFELVTREGGRYPAQTEAEALGFLEKIAEMDREVTAEFCFLCSRATDHRGEHELEELDREDERPAPEEDFMPADSWSGGFAANH